jgi:Domain of unknown function (DUF4430)
MTIRRLLLLASLLALILPAAAIAAPTAVDVRIEGKASTLFFDSVTTDGKQITTASGGTHPCDGSTASPPIGPGPTPNSALDDAAIKGGFTWDGSWFGTDFFASQIAGEAETPPNEFWGVFVNGAMLDVGGCQHILQPGDEVLWAYDAFSKTGAIKLTGTEATQTGRPVQVQATDTATGAPIAGATVGSTTTAGDGTASLSFDQPGVYRLKAEKPGLIRSRELRVCVDPPLVESCTSADRTAPTVRIQVPEIASSAGRFGFIRVSWLGTDERSGSGIRRYRVEKRRVDVPNAPWRAVAIDTPRTVVRSAAKEGSAYEFRVVAIDRAGNTSAPALARSLMPIDNLGHQLRFSKRGWVTLKRQGAFQQSVSRAIRQGASATLSFTGTQATVVTRKLPAGGRVRLTVDGKSKVVSLRGRGRFRHKLIASPTLAPGKHTLRVQSLGRAPIEIDAMAVSP